MKHFQCKSHLELKGFSYSIEGQMERHPEGTIVDFEELSVGSDQRDIGGSQVKTQPRVETTMPDFSGSLRIQNEAIQFQIAKGSLIAYRFTLLDDLRTIETWSNTKCDIIGLGGSQHRGERELWVLTCVTWGRGREVSVPSTKRSGAWRKRERTDPTLRS